MKKLRSFIESTAFQNAILLVIIFNSIIMGLQTSKTLTDIMGPVLEVLDYICLGIFIIEILLKLICYGFRFFTDGWNWFDLIVVVASLISGLSFLKVLRAFRIFRIFRTLKALKGIRGLRLVSRLDKLRMIIGAIGKSIPGISWSAVLLLLIYYIFAIIGVTLFGEAFPEWFGSIAKSLYTLFQVMTLESWSMGISRPVMEVFGWAWLYFVPFVLISSFIIMNVVVGIVVNSISEVQAELAKETEERKKAKEPELNENKAGREEILAQIASMKEQLDKLEKML